jgi:tellurite resistance protein TehA-like permease
MSFDPTSLLLSVLISAVGVGLFVYGKKQQRAPQLVAGIALLGYTYFVSSVAVMLAIAAAILCALWLAVRMGW